MSTTRQRLAYNMGPLLALVLILLIVGIWVGLLYGLFVSASRGDVAWTVCWGSLIVAGSVQNSSNGSKR